MRKKIFFITLYFLFIANNLFSENNPVTIKANNALYLQKQNKVIFTGNVFVHSKDIDINSKKLVVILKKNKKITADKKLLNSNSRENVIKKITAIGDVHIVMQDKEGFCDRAEYNLIEKKIVLIKNVKLIQNKNEIKGDRLVIDLKQNTSEIFSDNSNNVEITFFPEQNKKNSNSTSKK